MSSCKDLQWCLNIDPPKFTPSRDRPFKQSWKNRSVMTNEGVQCVTRMNRVPINIHVVFACLCKRMLDILLYGGMHREEEEENDEEENQKRDDTIRILNDVIGLCSYGTCMYLKTSFGSNEHARFCNLMEIPDGQKFSAMLSPSVHNLQYIKYDGPVDVRAVTAVSDFITDGGELPEIETIQRALCSICATNDPVSLATFMRTFDPIHLVTCAKNDNGLGNGGMLAHEYFNVMRDDMYDEHDRLLQFIGTQYS